MRDEEADGKYLVIIDADRIHDYVFAPRQLKLIRGGSRILLRLTEDELPVFADRVIVKGGGKIVAQFFTAERAESFLQKATELFRDRTGGATATSVSVPVVDWRQMPDAEGNEAEAKKEAWKRTREGAEDELESRKTSRKERHFGGGSPYWKSCDSCGLFSASRLYQDLDRVDRYPCEACFLRLSKGQAEREQDTARDFEELAEGSNPCGYLALIYVDGNRMGKFLADRGGGSPEEYKAASELVQEAVYRGVTEGCPESRRTYEILLMGGDDAIVMLQAQHVFQFLKVFSERCRINGLTFSAGVVWAHHHFPIAQFVGRAELLLASAKKANANSAVEENRVDFEIVTESMTRIPQHNEKPWTKRPYTMEEFVDLGATIAKWKADDMPANKVKALHEISRMDKDQAVLEYCFLLSRLKPEHRSLLLSVVPDSFWTGDLFRKTKAADLAELWDFVNV